MKISVYTAFHLVEQTFLGSYGGYSGSTYTKDHIWNISDEGAGIAQYDRQMNLIKLYPIGMDSPEGIALDEGRGLVYIVSDTTSELCIFKLPVHTDEE